MSAVAAAAIPQMNLPKQIVQIWKEEQITIQPIKLTTWDVIRPFFRPIMSINLPVE